MAERMFAQLSYEQVVRKYAQTVTSACLMQLQNWADAEDCFQNTFIKLYANAPDFKDENHLKAWLIRVAINECKNCLRRNRRFIPIDTLMNEPAPYAEDAQDISWALLRLEPKYREVLYLYYCEQYKVAEIASILGRNQNTVKTNLRRGREQLRILCGGDDVE